MFSNLPRRKRKIYMTLIPILLVIGLSAYISWQQKSVSNMILNEAPSSGITSKLKRPLPAHAPTQIFTDVTWEAGLHFRHFNKKRTSQLIEDMGSGVAWIDYNNDDWPDLFILNYTADSIAYDPGTHSKLYRNNADGSFSDVSREAGLSLGVQGMGTAWADYNNDGWIDALITSVGQNRLFRNNGDGTFTDVSQASGIAGPKGFWAGAAWGDFNLDGFADVYIPGYVNYFEIAATEEISNLQNPPSINPSVFPPVKNLLYRNNGDGTFTNVAKKAGVANENGKSLQAAWIDLNNDRYPDLYVTNDVSDNALFQNMGDGTFTNISYIAKVADYRGSMGLATGDWDGDRDIDLFITHWIAQENALYMNDQTSDGLLRFSDSADLLGLGQSGLSLVGWATSFLDIDNDTRQDLFVVNGHTFQKQDSLRQLTPQPDKIYWNGGPDEGFYDISRQAGDYFQHQWVGRGGAYADYNRDGKLDLAIVNHNGPAKLLKNVHTHAHHWLQLSLHGRQSNRSALNATIMLITPQSTQIRQVGSQGSYLSQNSLVQHFGLAAAQRVDTLSIFWPSGITQHIYHLPADTLLHITETKEKRLFTRNNNL